MILAESNTQDKRLVEVARSFYEEQLSKSEIAKLHQISITHVNRLLKEAQQKGIVEVVIKSPRFEDLETRLARRFKLREVRVVQSMSEPDSLRRELAEAAAEFLQPHLKDGVKVGVASGRTILETVSRIKESPCEIEIYPLNVLANDETEVKSLSANTISTILWFKCRPLASAYRFELFFPHGSISEVRKATRSSLGRPEAEKLRIEVEDLDVYVLGVSELRAESQLVELSRRCGADMSKLESSGVVGDVAFNTLDARGEFLPIGLEDLLFHTTLATLKNVSKKRDRFVLLIGGGSDKLAAIRAALVGRIFNCLVTDSAIAEALLAESGGVVSNASTFSVP
jgi:deoxyribonucleoside regulator